MCAYLLTLLKLCAHCGKKMRSLLFTAYMRKNGRKKKRVGAATRKLGKCYGVSQMTTHREIRKYPKCTHFKRWIIFLYILIASEIKNNIGFYPKDLNETLDDVQLYLFILYLKIFFWLVPASRYYIREIRFEAKGVSFILSPSNPSEFANHRLSKTT